MRNMHIIVLSYVFCLWVSVANATSIGEQIFISYGDEWKYSVTSKRPTNNSYGFVSWNSVDWKKGTGGFSNSYAHHPHTPSSMAVNNNTWGIGKALLLQKTIVYNEEKNKNGGGYIVEGLTLEGYIDNYCYVFINGNNIGGFTNYLFTKSISGNVLNNIWNQYGDNVIEVIAWDDSYRRTFFDMKITSIITSATPIPGAVWLLGSGLAGIIALRRRGIMK